MSELVSLHVCMYGRHALPTINHVIKSRLSARHVRVSLCTSCSGEIQLLLWHMHFFINSLDLCKVTYLSTALGQTCECIYSLLPKKNVVLYLQYWLTQKQVILNYFSRHSYLERKWNVCETSRHGQCERFSYFISKINREKLSLVAILQHPKAERLVAMSPCCHGYATYTHSHSFELLLLVK